MESALPSRLMAIAFLGDRHHRGDHVANAPRRDHHHAGGRLAIVTVPWLPYPTQPAAAPAFFRLGGGVERIAPGQVVLVTPFSSKVSTDAMYWQATANYRFRMPEGDAFTPGPYLGPHPSIMQSILDDLDAGQSRDGDS